MPADLARPTVGVMTTLDAGTEEGAQRPSRSDPTVTELTEKRFATMRPFTGGSMPPVDLGALPPGPRWPTLVQSAALLRFRHSFVPWAHRRYGDLFTVRIVPKGRPLVLFTRPEHIKEIFAGDPEVFHAGKGNAILGPMMGEHSLLLQDGSQHRRARTLLMPAFNGKALHSYEALVTTLAKDEVARWQPGTEFRALDRMNALTLEVILRVVFGVTDETVLAELRPRLRQTVNVSPAIMLGWAIPALARIGPWKRTVDNARELDQLLYAEIRARRTVPDLADRTDVLSRLIRVEDAEHGPLTDEELRDQLVTLLLAGHETTATALAWTLYELGRDADLLARAQQGDDAFLEALLKESMRLHPVIAMVARTLMKPATIAGREFPAGTTLAPSILISHSRDENHDAPGTFNPDRFLGTNPPTNTWIPFGGGVRRCIGAGFSLMEGVAVLREVLASYDLEAVEADVPKVRNITSVPAGGARIVVRAR